MINIAHVNAIILTMINVLQIKAVIFITIKVTLNTNVNFDFGNKLMNKKDSAKESKKDNKFMNICTLKPNTHIM